MWPTFSKTRKVAFDAPIDPQLARKPVANGVSRQALPDYLRSATITRR
jgi:hypothetical protein